MVGEDGMVPGKNGPMTTSEAGIELVARLWNVQAEWLAEHEVGQVPLWLDLTDSEQSQVMMEFAIPTLELASTRSRIMRGRGLG